MGSEMCIRDSRYSPNFSTVQPTARLTRQPTARSTWQNDASNLAKTRNSTWQPAATDTLEESKEESLAGAHARGASPNGSARGAPLKTKKRSAMKKERLENALYYRRQELESSGTMRFSADMLNDRERKAADEWLREHGEIGAKQGTGNGLDAAP